MAPDFRHRRQAKHDDTSRPVLITRARESYQDELAARKKRYYLLMSIRIPALLLAAGAMALWNNPWIAGAIVVGSIPIPWIAVISANDRPPLSKKQARTYAPPSMRMPGDAALPPSVRGELPRSDHPSADVAGPDDPGASDDSGRPDPDAPAPDPRPDESDPSP